MTRELNFGTPVAAVGTNLAAFMGNRLAVSFTDLGCQNFGLTSSVTVMLNGDGAASAVTYSLTQQVAKVTGASPTASASATANPGNQNQFSRKHHQQNQGGM
jgi:hypothetical protein